ncbi:alpha-galactosidase [Paraflavitalea soli]|uniref:Alpha-galactosidase n=2 Tax=Paraflavitalea soli TaxID=2315862 RepID=A0A3B7MGM3_9BACT|nr:alpha-galactosidase [Paraflavitalea soli]
MPFGKNNRISYNLNSGTYSVFFHDEVTIGRAFAAYEGKTTIKTTDPGSRKYMVSHLNDAWGKGKLYTIGQSYNGLWIQQLFYVYPGKSFFFLQVKVSGKEVAANYIAPLCTDHLTTGAIGDLRGLVVPFDNDMWVRFDAQSLQKANYTSSEVTALYNNDTRQGLLIGSVEHTVWKSGINVQHNDNNTISLQAFGGLSDSVITHDKIPHGKVSVNGNVCASPKIMVGLFTDWRAGMEQYAAANRMAEPPVIFKWNKATPMGWNSWGMMQTRLNLPKAKRVVDFFADSCKGFRNEDGTLYIDLDSYWDNLVQGGLNGDVSALKEFVQYCNSKGLKPGIYWAPFADWGKQDRKIEGSNWTYPASWITQHGIPMDVDGARAMDPTHPGTQERILHYINKFKELGFEMIKIDFLGHGALESDHYYDPAVTTGMQAYKVGMEFLDSVLTGKMLVYAAISPTMATARYVHMRRIACDAFSAIDNSEYTLNSTGYGWWQTHLYEYVDADHVVFNKETPGANRARLASALVTGTLITGDDFSEAGEWSATGQRLLQNKDLLSIIKDGRSFRPVEGNTGKRAPELFLRSIQGATYLAIFNYDNNKRSFQVPLDRLGLKRNVTYTVRELFTQARAGVTDQIEVSIPAGDVGLYRITQ